MRTEANVCVIACSFRSFDGGRNDTIQEAFLDALKSQKVPVHLVVTQWGETGVSKALDGSLLPYTLIENPKGLWSHTEVLANAVHEFPNTPVLWTTVDVTFGPEFLSSFISQVDCSNGFGTSWPHHHVNGNRGPQARNWCELDLVYLSGGLAASVSSLLNEVRNEGWGLFENQLTWAARKISGSCGVNISSLSRVMKQDNPRVELGEMPERLKGHWLLNRERWVAKLTRTQQIWLLTSWAVLNFSKTRLVHKMVAIRELLWHLLRRALDMR